MSEEENVKVVVRVRPFNKREKDRHAKNVVSMKGNITTLTNPEDSSDAKSFTYDYSYWSYDGYKTKPNGYLEPDPGHPKGKLYVDQRKVFNDLGKGILENAWKGYNATLFAYGQTGSGKSYSVIGYDENKGLVPMMCEEIFSRIKTNTEPKEFEVSFSMLEIYNEVVRDLLSTTDQKGGLKVRLHPKKGFYADGLLDELVGSYNEITAKMEQGTNKRTVRLTNMNATSSRAHTIVGITVKQKFKNSSGQDTTKSAIINLVDLAGSERVESTGATGARLKEGAAINLSLTTLGNVIHALVKKSQGDSGVRVPYRDSKLTKLLQNALGGNSKTIMIAAISPADINYSETLSTLHFADRAKAIKTKAVVNEDPTEKLIRELRMQNDMLKKQLQGGKVNAQIVDQDGDGIDDRDTEKLRQKWEEELQARMKNNDLELEKMRTSYEEKLKKQRVNAAPIINPVDEEKKNKPHITNLNMDPLLSKRVTHILKPKITSVGNQKGEVSDIKIVGPGIQEQHAIMVNDKNKRVGMKPVSEDCRILVNGTQITGETVLTHNDRIMFGSSQIWLFQNPNEKVSKKQPVVTYEYAQEEIAAKCGIDVSSMSDSKDATFIQNELSDVLPAVEEANAMSEEMDRKVKFEVILVSPQMRGETTGFTQVKVRVKHLKTGMEFVWTKDNFLARHLEMKEVYRKYSDEDEWDDDEIDEDPFQESHDAEIEIGRAQLHMKHIAHKVENKENLHIYGLRGEEKGILEIEVVPCNKDGKEYSEHDDIFVDKPEELIGRSLHFLLKIIKGRGLPNQYKDVYCSYQFYLDKEPVKTKLISGETNPVFNHKKKFSFTKVTPQLIEYLTNGSKPLIITLQGKQNVRNSAVHHSNGMTTRELLKNDRKAISKTAMLTKGGFSLDGRVVDPQKQSIVVELLLMKKTQARMQLRLDNVMKLLKEAENTSRLRISTSFLREILNSSSPEQTDALIRNKFAGESDGITDGFNPQKSSVCTLF